MGAAYLSADEHVLGAFFFAGKLEVLDAPIVHTVRTSP